MIPIAEIAAELAREAAFRRAAYPRMVERLQMSRDQEQAGYALCAAWAADCTRYGAYLSSTPPLAPFAPVARSGGFTWHERRAGIARELDQRARLYPAWVAAGRLDAAEATLRNARLSAMAGLYDDGHDWHDSFGTRPPFGRMDEIHLPEPMREARQQWFAHVHHVLAMRHGTPQLLAL
jgi:hypothetical protein